MLIAAHPICVPSARQSVPRPNWPPPMRMRDDDGALGRAIAEGRLVVRGAVHDLVSGELRPVEDATGVRG